MKKICLLLLLTVSTIYVMAQGDSRAPYQKDSLLPKFSIQLTDSSWFNNLNLPKKTPVVIIYFSPDCSHCQLTAHEFMQKMNEFDDAFFVWISTKPMGEISGFAGEYQMLNKKNIVIGRDTKYKIPPFYKLSYTPFIAVYNAKGKLVNTWDGGTDPDTVYKTLHPGKS